MTTTTETVKQEAPGLAKILADATLEAVMGSPGADSLAKDSEALDRALLALDAIGINMNDAIADHIAEEDAKYFGTANLEPEGTAHE